MLRYWTLTSVTKQIKVMKRGFGYLLTHCRNPFNIEDLQWKEHESAIKAWLVLQVGRDMVFDF